MATKLIKISRSILLKGIAFILIIASALVFILSVYSIKDVEYFESLFQDDIMKSEQIGRLYSIPINKLINALIDYNNEQKYNSSMSYFEKNKGIYYYVSDGVDTIENISSDISNFQNFKSYIYVDYNNFIVKPDNSAFNSYIRMIAGEHSFPYNTYSRYKIYIGLSDEFLEPIIEQWYTNRYVLQQTAFIIAASLLTALISFIYLIAVTGKKGSDNNIHLNFLDKLYTDINLTALILILSISISIFYDEFNFSVYSNGRYYQNYFYTAFCLTVLSINLVLTLSLVRHMKNKSLIKHSLIYTILNNFYKIFSGIFLGGPLMLKAMLVLSAFTFACVVGTILFPLIIPIFAVGVYLVYINIKRFRLIKYGVKSIKNGDIGYSMLIKGQGELAMLANDIGSIAEGLNEAVKNEVKSQRMKSELISNVSHDIKTPLTSIINYVDLLKKEGMDSENAPKYLDILEQKSQRLKVLTEDLFEAAKASSGDMPVDLEKLDIFSLIQQGFAELDDRIEKSGLHFKINIPEEKIYVLADGRLLWRVIENLLSNVFKYALKGSRVYIDVIDDKNSENVSLIIKNISSYELNVDVNELMERFKRADESRSSEGSGLGLAIAKDLMEMQKGSLNLEIDGDLFKSTVLIPKYIMSPNKE